MRPSFKMAAIFAAGFLLGGAASGLAIHHCFKRFGGPPPDRDSILKMLSSKLGLNDSQKEKVGALLNEHGPKMEALRKQTQESFKTQRDAFNSKLRLLLDEGQKKKMDEMNAKWENREKDRACHPFGCGPGDPTPGPPAK